MPKALLKELVGQGVPIDVVRNLPRLEQLYDTIEQPLIPVLQRMEYTGVLIDTGLLAQLSEEFRKRMAKIEAQAHDEPFHAEKTRLSPWVAFPIASPASF